MESLNYSNLLAYGAIGLGCILAVLAYFLLSREQDRTPPQKEMLTSIYIFMAFSLVLTCLGLGAELWKYSANQNITTATAKIAELQNELEKRNKSIDELQQKNSDLAKDNVKLETSREIVRVLMDQKKGPVERLKKLSPTNPDYTSSVAEMQEQVARLDDAINGKIKE